MLKYFLQYVLFFGSLFAAGAPAVGGGSGTGTGGSNDNAGGSAGAGGGAGSSGGTGGPGAAGGTQPNAGAQPGAQPGGDQNLKQLREAYEGVKAKFEPFEKLNLKPEQITQYSGVYQRVFTEAQQVGRELGYSDEDIAEALAADPIRTIDFLRTKFEQAAQRDPNQPDLQDLVQQHVEQALGPIQQRENVRMTDAANQLFEQTTRQLAVDSFKAEGLTVEQIPGDEMDFLMTATSEILKYDEAALKALKYEGKTGAVQKAFQEARTALDKYYLARATREKSRLTPPQRGAQPPAGQQQGGRKPTLDEMIENPALVNAKYS